MARKQKAKSRQASTRNPHKRSATRKHSSNHEIAARETRTYRTFFSLYCVGGFAVLVSVHSYLAPVMYGKSLAVQKSWSGTVPPYPFSPWRLLLPVGIPLFALVYSRVWIIRMLSIRESSQSRAFAVLVLFMAAMGLSMINFGSSIYIIANAIMYGVVFALIDGVRAYREDFSFLDRQEISESVRLAKLQVMHERWFWYLLTLATTSCVLLIGYAISWLLQVPGEVGSEATIMAVIVLGYLFLGIGLGAVADMLNKMKRIDGKILEV